jgi:plasmid maintenance system antidote protein VapI
VDRPDGTRSGVLLMVSLKRELGWGVQQRLQELGWKHVDLAIVLNVSPAYIYGLCSGQYNATLETIEALGVALRCDGRDLLRGLPELVG